MPHVGHSAYTPERIADSNSSTEFASQRNGLAPVSNRIDRMDGSAGRVPPPLTRSWVEEISTGYGSRFLKGNHELSSYFTTLSPFGKSHSSDGCSGSMMPIHINDDDSWHEMYEDGSSGHKDDTTTTKLYLSDPRPSATTMLLDGAMQNGEVPGQGG